MGWLHDLFASPPVPGQHRQEYDRLFAELLRIGETDGFLSERPGGSFNMQSRHIRAREIGKRLHDLGGVPLMDFAVRKTRRKLGKTLSAHLEYAWAQVGGWMP